MLFAVWPWFLHAFPTVYFPIDFRQSMGNSRWPCHGWSRSVTAFSDNAQDLNIVFCLLSRFVTQHVRQFEANMNLFPVTCNLRRLHFDNARAICDHQKWLHYLHAFPIWPYLCAWILQGMIIYTPKFSRAARSNLVAECKKTKSLLFWTKFSRRLF